MSVVNPESNFIRIVSRVEHEEYLEQLDEFVVEARRLFGSGESDCKKLSNLQAAVVAYREKMGYPVFRGSYYPGIDLPSPRKGLVEISDLLSKQEFICLNSDNETS